MSGIRTAFEIPPPTTRRRSSTRSTGADRNPCLAGTRSKNNRPQKHIPLQDVYALSLPRRLTRPCIRSYKPGSLPTAGRSTTIPPPATHTTLTTPLTNPCGRGRMVLSPWRGTRIKAWKPFPGARGKRTRGRNGMPRSFVRGSGPRRPPPRRSRLHRSWRLRAKVKQTKKKNVDVGGRLKGGGVCGRCGRRV